MILFSFITGMAFSTAEAQEVTIDDSESAVITGFIEDVYYNTFTIRDDSDMDNLPIIVSLQNFNLDSYNNIDALFSEGMRVRVYGRMLDGNRVEASRIVTPPSG